MIVMTGVMIVVRIGRIQGPYWAYKVEKHVKIHIFDNSSESSGPKSKAIKAFITD